MPMANPDAASMLADVTLISPRANGLARNALRYGLSSLGPLAISGAHFAASLMFLRALPPAQFGLLAFLFVIVPFCMSASGALVGAPIVTAIKSNAAIGEAELATYLKANLLIASAAAAIVFALVALSHIDIRLAAMFALYAGLMTLRWFARSLTYVTDGPARPIASDLVYSLILLAGLSILFVQHRLALANAADFLALAAGAALLVFGAPYLRQQAWPGRAGSLRHYGTIWRDITRWSLMGVVLTEMTANAHAYLVTFISGPQAFAVIAVGALLMRPAALVISALPDLERPVMARRLAAGDPAGALRSVKEFRTATGAVWLGTILLAGAILMWFPHLILKKGYDESQVVIVVAIYALIVAVRTLRGPESVFLQAAGEFKALAGASAWSSVTSLVATLALLLLIGPIASLAGILAGDLVMTGRIFALTRDWKLRHG
jgi:O-antigen/teichoic acid export membrane protein